MQIVENNPHLDGTCSCHVVVHHFRLYLHLVLDGFYLGVDLFVPHLHSALVEPVFCQIDALVLDPDFRWARQVDAVDRHLRTEVVLDLELFVIVFVGIDQPHVVELVVADHDVLVLGIMSSLRADDVGRTERTGERVVGSHRGVAGARGRRRAARHLIAVLEMGAVRRFHHHTKVTGGPWSQLDDWQLRGGNTLGLFVCWRGSGMLRLLRWRTVGSRRLSGWWCSVYSLLLLRYVWFLLGCKNLQWPFSIKQKQWIKFKLAQHHYMWCTTWNSSGSTFIYLFFFKEKCIHVQHTGCHLMTF